MNAAAAKIILIFIERPPRQCLCWPFGLTTLSVSPGFVAGVGVTARVAAGFGPFHSQATVPGGCLYQPGSL
jgi:hypothetical protein